MPEPTMRVMYLVDTLNIGGTENQVVQAAIALHAAGHALTVGCLRAEGALLPRLQEANIPVVEFRKQKSLASLAGIRQLVRLARFLRKGDFDVIHAHDLWANLLGVPAGWLARTPVIISSRRYLADLEWYKPWKNRIMGIIYRRSTQVVVNSKAVKALLGRRHELRKDHIRVIYNCLDVDRFTRVRSEKAKLLPQFSSPARLIAVLANMYSPVKGHAYLISAAHEICRKAPESVFLMIGDGPERPRLERQVNGLALQRNFLFLGGRTDVAELLACCDLGVLPSEAESLPNALLEMMAAGLPVVATSAGGALEVVDHEVDGLLVPPQNS